jgi:hypothetical protein
MAGVDQWTIIQHSATAQPLHSSWKWIIISGVVSTINSNKCMPNSSSFICTWA